MITEDEGRALRLLRGEGNLHGYFVLSVEVLLGVTLERILLVSLVEIAPFVLAIPYADQVVIVVSLFVVGVWNVEKLFLISDAQTPFLTL